MLVLTSRGDTALARGLKMLRSNQRLLGSCFVLALASVMITAAYGQAPGDEDVISGLKGRWKIESE